MANWICNEDGTVFPPGWLRCPELDCGARNAHEDGGDPDVNVFERPPEVTAAEGIATIQAARAYHDAGRGEATGQAHELMTAAQAEVAERLGDVDVTYREPSAGDAVELDAADDGTGRHLPDAVEGDTTERVDDRQPVEGDVP